MNFAIFAGEQYYPEGGWSDFQSTFATKEEAITFYEKSKKKNQWDWGHVVDLSTLEEVHDLEEDD